MSVPNDSPARRAAEAYQEHVNAGDADALVALFAEDAVLFHPVGEFTGPDAIRGFYETNVLPFGVQMDAVSWVHDEQRCVFEIEAAPTPRDRPSSSSTT